MKFDRVTIISILGVVLCLILEIFGVRCSCIILTSIYFLLLISSVKKYSATHSYVLFLLWFGIFLMGRVFLDVLGIIEVNHATKWMDYYLTNKTVVIVNISMALSIIFINIGINSKVKIVKNSISEEKLSRFYIYTKRLIIILIPFATIKLYYDFSQVLSGAYTDLYMNVVKSPFIIRAGWYLATLAVPLLLANTLNKKQFKTFVVLFVLVNFFSFISGARGGVIYPIMFLLWYYYRVISKEKLKTAKFLLFLVFINVLAGVIMTFREGKQEGYSGPVGSMMYIFETIGGSYYFNAYYVDFHDELDGIDQLYVIGPVIDGYVSFFDRDLRGQSEARLKKGLSLSQKMTYYISPKSYDDGHGLGSSYIAEIYSTAGFFSLIFFSFWVGKFIAFVEFNVDKSPIVRVISWDWIINLIVFPRAQFLSFLINMIFTLLLFKILFALFNRQNTSIVNVK